MLNPQSPMKKMLLISLIALAVNALSALPVSAGTKPGVSVPNPDLPSSSVAELTRKECTDLGGRVKNDKYCASGKTCRVANDNGDTHTVCLEAAQ